MDFDRFTRCAQEMLTEVPAEYLEGILGVTAHEEAKSHPHLPEVSTLGECVPDEVTALAEPAAPHSRLHLYHGSFVEVARNDPGFDWEGELRETILHEIRHHLEDQAGLLDLIREDAVDEALSRWFSGEEFPEGWYRGGERLEESVWRLSHDLFVELRLRRLDLARLAGSVTRLSVLGEPFDAELPEDIEPGETLTFEGEGLERPGGSSGALHLVLRPE